ncbi:PQQ-binding-like beta-propeller repeat protein [Adhaeribacter aquaticus]|uniref:outer membrane protein assembly factor BamB family protein n=1 Tax=Adhaeribacter aquaticus TaxID=299567 RepID=UPI00040B0BD6|nr:PQQ-binding-like beta-propeller repeat protein [Adhaeribacter aquaticus]
MLSVYFRKLAFALFFIFAFSACDVFSKKEEAGVIWSSYIPDIGTFSSPRTVDLNKDGVLDIVLGAGARENRASDKAVVAFDGATGETLWSVKGRNQFVGSAIFQDINSDAIPDVFIGGRWAELMAINGADGKVLWSFYPERPTPNPADAGWFNFTTPQFVPDQDNDGLKELIIANGGNPAVPPNDPNRPTGRLLVISSKTGKILANVQVPDGKETYMSVVCLHDSQTNNLNVLFGTGGETMGGHLYRTTLKDIMKGDISSAKVLASSEKKGFIAPPVLVDLTLDGTLDVVVSGVEGRIFALDGKNDATLWQVELPGTEGYATPGIGYFNEDSVPDVFSHNGIGVYPNIENSVLYMLNGKTGKIEFQEKVPGFQYSSPLVADFNADGQEDGLLNFNEIQYVDNKDTYSNYLQVYDFFNHKKFTIADRLEGTVLAATPWIGNLDQDKSLDIIHLGVNFKKIKYDPTVPRGLFISRYATNLEVRKPMLWGAYMGSDYSGVFRK